MTIDRDSESPGHAERLFCAFLGTSCFFIGGSPGQGSMASVRVCAKLHVSVVYHVPTFSIGLGGRAVFAYPYM